METDTPEYYYAQIQAIQYKLQTATTNDQYKEYYQQLAVIKSNIQSQMDLIINDQPLKSQQLFGDYKEMYKTNYFTNLCLFLGICLIVWNIIKGNSKTNASPSVDT